MSFRDSSYYEEAVETPVDVLWWTSQVLCIGPELVLYDFTLYSATGTRLQIGYTAIRHVFRHIEEQATAEGFLVLRLEAVRVKPGKPERMLLVRRGLV